MVAEERRQLIRAISLANPPWCGSILQQHTGLLNTSSPKRGPYRVRLGPLKLEWRV